MSGRGIILIATNHEDLVNALAVTRLLRAQGSTLPIECWHGTPAPRRAAALLRALGAMLRPCPRAAGSVVPWTRPALRLHALAETKWRDVLVLATRAFPLSAPDALFDRPAFQKSGTLFHRQGRNAARAGAWKMCGLTPPRDTAQAAHFLIDRSRCWPALPLWRWIAERNYFFHGYLDGEGGAAQLAFARLDQPLPLVRASGAFWVADSGTPPPAVVRRHLRAAWQALS